MPVTLTWLDDEKYTLLFTFSEPWSMAEFHVLRNEAAIIASDLDHVTDAIFDFTRTSRVPRHTLTGFISGAKRTLKQPNEGASIIISKNPLAQTLFQVITRVMPPGRMFIVDDLPAARRLAADLQHRRGAESG